MDCCGPFVQGETPASTAEQLMRSRYTAYAIGAEGYLLSSWHPDTRPESISLTTEQVQWIGLKILHTEAGSPADEKGIVEFIARYKQFGKAFRLSETSRFNKIDGQWYYIDGDIK